MRSVIKHSLGNAKAIAFYESEFIKILVYRLFDQQHVIHMQMQICINLILTLTRSSVSRNQAKVSEIYGLYLM